MGVSSEAFADKGVVERQTSYKEHSVCVGVCARARVRGMGVYVSCVLYAPPLDRFSC